MGNDENERSHSVNIPRSVYVSWAPNKYVINSEHDPEFLQCTNQGIHILRPPSPKHRCSRSPSALKQLKPSKYKQDSSSSK